MSTFHHINIFFLFFLFQACFLGFECAMKFLNWLAPDLWWRLSVTFCMNPRNRTLEDGGVISSTKTHAERFYQVSNRVFDYLWNLVVLSGMLIIQSSHVLMTLNLYQNSHTDSRMFSLLSVLLVFWFVQIVLFLYEKRSDLNMRALAFVIFDKVYISGKKCILLYCVFSLSTVRAFLSAASCVVTLTCLFKWRIMREIIAW